MAEFAAVMSKIGLKAEYADAHGSVVLVKQVLGNNQYLCKTVPGGVEMPIPAHCLGGLDGVSFRAGKIAAGHTVIVKPQYGRKSSVPIPPPYVEAMRDYAGKTMTVARVMGDKLEMVEDGGLYVWSEDWLVLIPSSKLDPRNLPYGVGDTVVTAEGDKVIRAVAPADAVYYLEGDGETTHTDAEFIGRKSKFPIRVLAGDTAFLSVEHDGMAYGKQVSGGQIVTVLAFPAEMPNHALVAFAGGGVMVVGMEYLFPVSRRAGAAEWVDWDVLGQPMAMRWKGNMVRAYVLTENGTVLGKGTARCHPDDAGKFDLHFGVKLAKLRAAQVELLKSI